MDINDLTLGQLQKLKDMFFGESAGNEINHPYEIGENYFIRTVTNYLTGKLVFVGPQELVLEDAAWIPDTGRFHNMLKNGVDSIEEVEPFPSGKHIVGRGAIVDMCIWSHPLPREQK